MGTDPIELMIQTSPSSRGFVARLRSAVFACALLLGLLPGAMSTAVAQHALDAETWVEMRNAGTG
jgi:hypothetical protein